MRCVKAELQTCRADSRRIPADGRGQRAATAAQIAYAATEHQVAQNDHSSAVAQQFEAEIDEATRSLGTGHATFLRVHAEGGSPDYYFVPIALCDHLSCVMSLTLYAHPFSSYCQKVLVALYENDLPFEYRTLERPISHGRAEATLAVRAFSDTR